MAAKKKKASLSKQAASEAAKAKEAEGYSKGS
jgi:hypothetical protein